MKIKENQEIENFVENSINEIYASLQDSLGQKYGDNAAQFHSGEGEELVEKLQEHFVKYYKFELKILEEKNAEQKF